ncbi:uncharacterized protein LOC119363137 isoform X1 [Triticum dicoccoides]|uniref:uncharacterized protein LOC119363137 isoform X1 n=1 Tax=Triticum dicoccoides TaxID=85692 RepID=UPI0018909268|nr:uncharacterized protein LOC119363137 isoform X1 [Triticum dicoccoides]
MNEDTPSSSILVFPSAMKEVAPSSTLHFPSGMNEDEPSSSTLLFASAMNEGIGCGGAEKEAGVGLGQSSPLSAEAEQSIPGARGAEKEAAVGPGSSSALTAMCLSPGNLSPRSAVRDPQDGGARDGHGAAAHGVDCLRGAGRLCLRLPPRVLRQQLLTDGRRALPDQPGPSSGEGGRSGADAGGPALLRGGRRRVLHGARAQAVHDPGAVPLGLASSRARGCACPRIEDG